MPHDACLVPALSLGSSRSCATPKHGARSIASPRLIARCRRARCRSTASEAGAGTSLAMFLRSIFHGRSYLQRRRKTVRSAGLRCSQRSHPSSSGAAIGVLAHATSGSDFCECVVGVWLVCVRWGGHSLLWLRCSFCPPRCCGVINIRIPLSRKGI